jgi:transglutaminase-like putative cysteine protease
MRVAIEHRTTFRYDAEVVESVMDLRLGPRTDEHQRWVSFDLRVEPAGAIRRYNDGFGNAAHLVTIARPHRTIGVVTRSEIETTLADPFERPRARPTALGPGDAHDALGPSALVSPSAALEALAGAVPADEPAFATAERLMHLVHARLDYRPDVTTVSTTVEEVLAQSSGVCQDFAHLLIGLCRAVRLPARYVSGYIVSGAAAGTPTRGAGASHAWAEVFTPTHGWRGFDPTNDLLASEHHVKMAVGRDYADIPPTRGAYRGDASEELEVAVVGRALGPAAAAER